MKIRSRSESHIVELEDGSRWQIFPSDLDLTLAWTPDTDLTVVAWDDEVESQCWTAAKAVPARAWPAKLTAAEAEACTEGAVIPCHDPVQGATEMSRPVCGALTWLRMGSSCLVGR